MPSDIGSRKNDGWEDRRWGLLQHLYPYVVISKLLPHEDAHLSIHNRLTKAPPTLQVLRSK